MTASKTLPTLFISHGGGPWPWLDWGGRNPFEPLAAYLRGIPGSLGLKPAAVLMISGHWDERLFTVMTHPRPPMLHDYYGFPPETYQVRYTAPGSPELARKVRELLAVASIPSGEDPERGFDHGAFVPLAVMLPEADIPVVQLSIRRDYDVEAHLAAGRALAALRSEGVLIIGSGLSYHNLREMMGGGSTVTRDSQAFDAWLTEVVCDPDTDQRDRELTRWSQAPAARRCHPREDHLIPLLVAAGAAGRDRAIRTFNDLTSPGDGLQPFASSCFQFGSEFAPRLPSSA